MQDITLVKALVGLSGISNDHYMRHHAPNVESQDIDRLMEARLGNTGRASPFELTNIASRTGGLSMQSEGLAFIEDGWGVSRGLALLEFIVSDNVFNQEKLTVLGYVAGGEISYDGGIPPELMFVPTRMWQTEARQVSDHQGFPVIRNAVTKSAQFLLNDRTSDGLHSIRPKDIIENSLAHQAVEDQDNHLSGGSDTGFQSGDWAGSAMSALKISGLALSNIQNGSTTHYAQSLLESSLTAKSEMERSQDRYSALTGPTSMTSMREMSHRDNAFMDTMRNSLGRTASAMSGFEGFSFGEIAHVFDTFTDVLNLNAANTGRFDVDDHRLNTSEYGTSNMCEVMAQELAMLSYFLLTDNQLMTFSISGTNNVMDGAYTVNGLPVDYQAGELSPITDNLNLDFGAVVERIKEQITTYFFGKHCSEYAYSRQIVEFTAEFVLFGDTTVTVAINGDPATARTYSIGTFASNRFDPNLTTRDGSTNSTRAFFDNLVNHFDFN